MSGGFSADFLFDDDENEEYEHSHQPTSTRDSIIFLIDCNSSMFAPQGENGEVPFHNAMRAAMVTLQDKIIASEHDLVGIVFYSSNTARNVNDFPNIFVFRELDSIDVRGIKQCEEILEDGAFAEQCGGSFDGPFPFYYALWSCAAMFRNCTQKLGFKRIFLFTNNDAPNHGDRANQERARERAKDLYESDVDIELFTLDPPDRPFDPVRFFNRIIPNDENVHRDVAAKFAELQTQLRRKEYTRRAYCRIPWQIAPGLNVGVGIYHTCVNATPSSAIFLDSKTGLPLRCETRWVCQATGTLLRNNQIKVWHPYGPEKIAFDSDELKEIKRFGEPSITLMGFKPRASVKVKHALTHPLFMFPAEDLITGSTTAFHALYRRMLDLDRVAICRMIARKGSQPRFMCCLPLEERKRDDGSQLTPPGFSVIPLPYADDIRDINVEPTQRASPEQILKAKAMVAKLSINFSPEDFANPALQRHYAALQALALDHDIDDEVEDLTKPDNEHMLRHRAVIESFATSTFPSGVPDAAPKASASTSRKRTAEGGGAAARKAARPDPEAMTDDQWKDQAQGGTLKSFTIPQLKVFLKAHRLALSGKKDQLIQRIVDHFA